MSSFLCLVKKSQQKLGSQAKPMFIQKGRFLSDFRRKSPGQDRRKQEPSSYPEERRRKPMLLALTHHGSQPCGDRQPHDGEWRSKCRKACLGERERRERSSLMSGCLLSVRDCTGPQNSWEGKVQYLIKGTVIVPISSGWAGGSDLSTSGLSSLGQVINYSNWINYGIIRLYFGYLEVPGLHPGQRCHPLVRKELVFPQ